MATQTIDELRESVEAAKLTAEYNALVAHNRIAEYQNSVLLESHGSFVDPGERWYDEPNFYPIAGNYNAPYYQSEVDDRECGQFRPIFETEHDLSMIRAKSNRVVWFDEIGLGALDSLKNYIFQEGLQFVPTAVSGSENKALIDETAELIEHILRINGYWEGLDGEYHDRARVDGEVLTELVWEDDVRWKDHEPMHLTEPDMRSQRNLEDWQSSRVFGEQCWKFGVHTLKRDTSKAFGYHLVFDKEGRDWNYIPEDKFVLYKRNVYRSVKRGISDFFVVVRDLERDSKLVERLVLCAAMQASIPWAVEYPEGAKTSSIQSAVIGAADYTRTVRKESGTQHVAVNTLAPGTIPHIKKGGKYIEGPLATRNSSFIEVSQHVRRTIGVRFQMPEFMISGDASNANYSSSTIHADSFVKARQSDQRAFGQHTLCLIWKSLKMYHDRGKYAAGSDWEDLKRSMRITVDGKDPSTKSPLEKRQALALEIDYGLTSPRTASTECGRHYDKEVEEGAERGASPNMEAEQKMTGTDDGDGDEKSEQKKKEKEVKEAIMEGLRSWNRGF